MIRYRAGRLVKTMAAFYRALDAGTLLWISSWQKTAHPIILANMQYRIVRTLVERGVVFIARRIKKGAA